LQHHVGYTSPKFNWIEPISEGLYIQQMDDNISGSLIHPQPPPQKKKSDPVKWGNMLIKNIVHIHKSMWEDRNNKNPCGIPNGRAINPSPNKLFYLHCYV
jgi:hypothetical protein